MVIETVTTTDYDVLSKNSTFSSLYSAGQAAVRDLYTVDLVQPWWRLGSEGAPVRKDSTGEISSDKTWCVGFKLWQNKTEGLSSLLREEKFITFDNNIIQWHSQISLADHEWETWKRVAREVDAIIIISNIIVIIIIITRPKLANSRFCISIDRLESKYGCNQKNCRSGSSWQPSQFSLKVSFDKLKFWLLTKVLTN